MTPLERPVEALELPLHRAVLVGDPLRLAEDLLVLPEQVGQFLRHGQGQPGQVRGPLLNLLHLVCNLGRLVGELLGLLGHLACCIFVAVSVFWIRFVGSEHDIPDSERWRRLGAPPAPGSSGFRCV